MNTLEQTLAGRTIAVPESRELDVFAAMLERRGARVVRCPLVTILDAPDPAPVLAWLRSFSAGEMQYLVLLTGEGLRRLLSCIERYAPSLKPDFLLQLARSRKITRGPKPARALRELGLKPDVAAETPTTQGVIAVCAAEDLSGRTIGVQLYGSEPNTPLTDFLSSKGASVRTVAPYVYADESADSAVEQLLHAMAAGDIDVIAFTSSAQVARIFAVGGGELCRSAFAHTTIAAIGPVVAEALARRGVAVQLTPRDSFFLKPLTTAIAEALGPGSAE